MPSWPLRGLLWIGEETDAGRGDEDVPGGRRTVGSARSRVGWGSTQPTFWALGIAVALAGAAPFASLDFLYFELKSPGGTLAVIACGGLDDKTIGELARHPERAARFLTVVTVHDQKEPLEGQTGRPPLLGSYQLLESCQVAGGERGVGIKFRARFPAEPGVTYRAVYRPPGRRGKPFVVHRSIPVAPASKPTTTVLRVSPSADTLPENLLRFYLEFSAPMSRGEAYEHVRLLDANGKPLDLPFLELGEELWDPRGVRFTLLFDPGRIKTGLKPREDLGPVLEKGKPYTLVVDRGWHDAAGNPLKAEFRKPFGVGPPDMTPPDPSNWQLDRPAAETRKPLVAHFPEPLDRAMLARVLAVVDAKDQRVPGRAEVGNDETSWSFTPETSWQTGRYRLLVDRALEDRAGNSVGRPFEVDVFDKVERTPTTGTVALPFSVGGPGGD
jgi:hypothetical protein